MSKYHIKCERGREKMMKNAKENEEQFRIGLFFVA